MQNASPSSQTRPNLIFFCVDEHAWNAVGYEDSRIKTPNIDRLARSGMIFRAAHCAAIPCVPSRACFLSGLNYHRWERISDNPFEAFLKEGHWTWAHALRHAGYRTGVFGALHAHPVRASHGFDIMQMCDYGGDEKSATGGPLWRDDYYEFLRAQGLNERLQANGQPAKPNGTIHGWEWPHDPALHPISWVRDRACEFLRARRPSDPPFAIQISFRFPHPPYIPAEPFASLYDPASIPVPKDSWTDMEGYIPALDFDPKAGFNGIAARPPDKEFRAQTAKYYGLISQIDDAIGTILRHVDLTTTLILYGADHGDFRGRRGRIMKIPCVPFEAASRVPFFAAGCGVPAGGVSDNPVSMIDLPPTFLRAAGIEISPSLDGHPLQDYFADPGFGAGRPVFCHGSHGLETVQLGKIKYFRNADKTQEMLFDLAADPDEKKNIAGAPAFASIKRELINRLEALYARPAPRLPRFNADSCPIS